MLAFCCFATIVVDGGGGENVIADFFHVDDNECSKGNHNCDAHARCFNTHGAYRCQCNAGYIGEGTKGNCTGKGFLYSPSTPFYFLIVCQGRQFSPQVCLLKEVKTNWEQQFQNYIQVQ